MTEKQKKELFRKSFHVSSILLPLSYYFIFHYNRKLMFLILVPLTVTALIIEIARIEHKTFKRIFYNLVGILLRKHEIHNFTGATYLMMSALLCIGFFPADIAVVSLAFLAIGDTLAALVGIPLGKRKILNTSKSLEGSLACFAGCFVFGLFFLNPVVALIGAFTATVAEFSRIPIDDNIKIPIISGLVMSFVNMFF
ncbi:MAG: phosphatidate cytidylyltransferase [Candidatus Cloacimonetes bacterium]|nr:phosphatidate cytidylyltransferase [Candidatus Cloacimonadota bacterium]